MTPEPHYLGKDTGARRNGAPAGAQALHNERSTQLWTISGKPAESIAQTLRTATSAPTLRPGCSATVWKTSRPQSRIRAKAGRTGWKTSSPKASRSSRRTSSRADRSRPQRPGRSSRPSWWAVQQLRGALGTDPVALLQKGMNYDHKAERELRVLDQYAAASGMTRAQYLAQIEQAQQQAELNAELEKARSEFPEAPDAALQEIARNRVAAKRAAEQQQRAQQQAAVQQVQQRAQQAVQEARRKAEIKGWDDYEKLAGVHKPEDIPPRVVELVQKEGMTPVAAHWRYQAEQAQQQNEINKKDQQNRQQSAGSLTGAGDTADDFLAGLFG